MSKLLSTRLELLWNNIPSIFCSSIIISPDELGFKSIEDEKVVLKTVGSNLATFDLSKIEDSIVVPIVTLVLPGITFSTKLKTEWSYLLAKLIKLLILFFPWYLLK